ncbi:MAG: hypothetical protein MJZ01_06070 [Bacteroidales bacterium]|nr:hypothetical protein [Bacteroidales bacterium]
MDTKNITMTLTLRNRYLLMMMDVLHIVKMEYMNAIITMKTNQNIITTRLIRPIRVAIKNATTAIILRFTYAKKSSYLKKLTIRIFLY